METVATKKLDRFVQSLTPTTISLPKEQLDHAKAILEQKDFPTTRDEAWKYTRVGKIAAIESKSASTSLNESDWQPYLQENVSAAVVFVNGVVQQIVHSKKIEGLHITAFSQCSEEELSTNSESAKDIFDALNLVYLNDGIKLTLEKNSTVDQPVLFIHLFNGSQSVHHSRLNISLAQNSTLEIIQRFINIGAGINHGNNHSEIQLADNSQLEMHKIQVGLKTNYLISRETVQQADNSTFTLHTHTAESAFVRNDTTVRVNGTNAETNLYGSYLLKEDEHVDNHTCIDHRAPHCLSNELYKGVIGGKATAVFNGKVFVRQDAQKINAFQSNANVLTSDLASVNSKPELEIYADDVKCSHGSTTGQLDDEAVFYLRARGISEKAAKDLMIQAFLDDVFSKTTNSEVQEILEEAVSTYFV
jgi:Fe-S cluster assembly protein SufD